jgi:hypothetical protein
MMDYIDSVSTEPLQVKLSSRYLHIQAQNM